MPSITTTKNYGLFRLHVYNRNVDNIKRLEKSMRQYGWIDAYPMHVYRNGKKKLVIKAGHHRFEVARKLGIPVKYVVCDDSATIYELESSTNNWNLKDFLVSCVKAGDKTYIEIQEYHEKTGIPLFSCISLLAGQGANTHNKIQDFKLGEFTIKDRSRANRVADVVVYLKNQGIGFASNSLLVSAIDKALFVPHVKIAFLKNKLKNHSHLIEKRPSVDSYLDMLETIYNFKTRHKIPLAFIANELAKERSAV